MVAACAPEVALTPTPTTTPTPGARYSTMPAGSVDDFTFAWCDVFRPYFSSGLVWGHIQQAI